MQLCPPSSPPQQPCLGSVLPLGNQCSFYSLIHTPHIDLCLPGQPACIQGCFCNLHRWPTWTYEGRLWCSRPLIVGVAGNQGEKSGQYEKTGSLQQDRLNDKAPMACSWMESRVVGRLVQQMSNTESIHQAIERQMEAGCQKRRDSGVHCHQWAQRIHLTVQRF